MKIKAIIAGAMLSAVSAAQAFAGGFGGHGGHGGYVPQTPVCDVPEPTTLGLVALGVTAAVMVARSRRA